MSTIGISLYYLFDILSWIIVIRSFMTWLPNGGGKFYDILSTITEPIEGPIRSIMYKYSSGPIDFSPMIAIIALMLLKNIALRVFI
ncbi:MAG: YggT family protein [Romboutsia sp.]|jgi:YggT family protein|nr:YggT family protein [Romboutsia sp.]